MESDKKLEKLETFLGRLNSKGELIDARSAQFLVLFAGGCYESIIEVRVKKDYCIICVFKKRSLLFQLLSQCPNNVPFIEAISLIFLFLSFLSVSGLQETTLTVTEKAVKEVMRLDDEVFSKFYRHMTDIPRSMSSRMHLDEDFDAIFGKQTPM